MKLYVNGKLRETSCINLAQLMQELNSAQEWIVSAVNSKLVKQAERSNYQLQEGDKIEILAPMQGG